MLTLYQRTDCPFCWKVRIVLARLQLECRLVSTALGEVHPEVALRSPTRSVPLLVDDGTAIWDSAVIVEYLEQVYGSGQLIPADATAAVNVRLLHTYSDKLLGSSLRELVFEKRSKPVAEQDMGVIERGRESWRECQAYLERALGRNPYFSPGIGAADCALGARCGVAEAYGEGVSNDFPALSSWYQRLRNWQGWQTAYPESFIRCK